VTSTGEERRVCMDDTFLMTKVVFSLYAGSSQA
jgi:hypothetical protein